MSLINQMLQDLDARAGASSNQAADLYAKPVARRAGMPSKAVLAGGAVAVVSLAVAGALGWRYFHQTAAPAQAPKAAKVTMMARTAAPQPVATSPKPVGAPDPKNEPTPAPDSTTPALPAAREQAVKPVRQPKAKPAEVNPPAAPVRPSAPQGRRHVKGGGVDPAVQPREDAASVAEAIYRKALGSLQDGWTSEAISSLERALQANPKHEAARQTLVSLLMENKRYDEAMRQLQAGLAADPRQPALAMLLARLQIERGGSGIDTLTRTLPYASGNGEYHAFLAGALQRQGRNSEAAAQYQAALRSAPQNGVWWMGLGIALQGDKRDSEALEAFRRARSNGLSPELQSFVDRKIQQLSR